MRPPKGVARPTCFTPTKVAGRASLPRPAALAQADGGMPALPTVRPCLRVLLAAWHLLLVAMPPHALGRYCVPGTVLGPCSQGRHPFPTGLGVRDYGGCSRRRKRSRCAGATAKGRGRRGLNTDVRVPVWGWGSETRRGRGRLPAASLLGVQTAGRHREPGSPFPPVRVAIVWG